MIKNISIFTGVSVDPWYNLAVEQYLLEHVEPGCCILYLWQNRQTVVIGRNQNAWKECRTTLLEEEGGRLSRRLSGGGAVFHDLGNLNFTFLVHAEDYDVRRQLEVVCEACRDLGIPAEISGRNDVLADGRKFSGNAFYKSGGRCYHHGTLMVAVDKEMMTRYLSPSKAKLQTKGVDSVRSRVANLSEFVPGLTCREMAEKMEKAFEKVYGLEAVRLDKDSLDSAEVEALREKNASWEWLYGSRLPFTFTCEERFSWGELQLQLAAESGIVRQAKVYTDSMDWSLAPLLEKAFAGQRFSQEDLCRAVRDGLGECPEAEGICGMLERQEI